jgi:hypothetical protein
MQLPAIQGIIDRRMLVNYRLDPAVAARVIPPPFRQKSAELDCALLMRGIEHEWHARREMYCGEPVSP